MLDYVAVDFWGEELFEDYLNLVISLCPKSPRDQLRYIAVFVGFVFDAPPQKSSACAPKVPSTKLSTSSFSAPKVRAVSIRGSFIGAGASGRGLLGRAARRYDGTRDVQNRLLPGFRSLTAAASI